MYDAKLFKAALDYIADQPDVELNIYDAPTKMPLKQQKHKKLHKAKDRTISYTSRFNGMWFRPEYDFDEIQIAQDSDSYLSRALRKKINKLVCAGVEFTGQSPDAVDYIKRRFAEFAHVTGVPLMTFFEQLFADVFRFNNCMVVKVRDRKASSGKVRTTIDGTEVDPVAGLFILPFETLQFKTKANGDFKKVLQRMPNGERKEFFPRDLVHFFIGKKPGFAVATPELWPALDDIQLLRRIEENVEELIETNLFPVYHYKVGTDAMPERVTPEGDTESDVVKRTIEYMPASGVYVSDHRHQIEAIGSEGRALRIDFYLTYFKNRVFAAIGTSSVDMGEGDSANRSTASTLSKGMLLDVEAAAILIKGFFDLKIINELLEEGGFDPMDQEHRVEIAFGVIDKEEKRAQENHLMQTYQGKIRDMDETRKHLGEKPWRDEQMDRTYYKMFEEPLALVKSMGAGSAAGSTLAGMEVSNVTPESVKKEAAFAKQVKAAGGSSGAKPKSSSSGSNKSAAARNRPSNQHGTRSTAKTNRDLTNDGPNITIYSKDGSHEYHVELTKDISEPELAKWIDLVHDRHELLRSSGISFDTVVENLLWRISE